MILDLGDRLVSLDVVDLMESDKGFCVYWMGDVSEASDYSNLTLDDVRAAVRTAEAGGWVIADVVRAAKVRTERAENPPSNRIDGYPDDCRPGRWVAHSPSGNPLFGGESGIFMPDNTFSVGAITAPKRGFMPGEYFVRDGVTP